MGTIKNFFSRIVFAAPLLALAVWLVPFFLSMPLSTDTVAHDAQARAMENGDLIYRDVDHNGMPGILYLHLLVRKVTGPSSEGMRAFDLVVLTACLWLISLWMKRAGNRRSTRAAAVGGLFVFYVSLPEWCHCQVDLWMLFFALVALNLRWQHHVRRRFETLSSVMFRGSLEGLFWMICVCLKPVILLPALACLGISIASDHNRDRRLNDGLGVFRGALVFGLVCWYGMSKAGSWPWFVSTIQEWSPAYFSGVFRTWSLSHFRDLGKQLLPWAIIHVVAIPLAVKQLVMWWKERNKPIWTRCAVLAGFYLAWLLQSLFMQYPVGFVHVPGVMLAFPVVLSHRNWPWHGFIRGGVVFGCLIIAMLMSRFATVELSEARELHSLWLSCVHDGSSVENRASLSLQRAPN